MSSGNLQWHDSPRQLPMVGRAGSVQCISNACGDPRRSLFGMQWEKLMVVCYQKAENQANSQIQANDYFHVSFLPFSLLLCLYPFHLFHLCPPFLPSRTARNFETQRQQLLLPLRPNLLFAWSVNSKMYRDGSHVLHTEVDEG